MAQYLNNLTSAFENASKKIILPLTTTSTLKSNPNYLGCYNDDGNESNFKYILGNVKSVDECINLGKTQKHNYVGLIGGNVCKATDDKAYAKGAIVNDNLCNINCSSGGTCGGFNKAQVYRTGLTENFTVENNINYITIYVSLLVILLLMIKILCDLKII